MSYLSNVGQSVGDGVSGVGESIGGIISAVLGGKGKGGSIQDNLGKKRLCESQGGVWDGEYCALPMKSSSPSQGQGMGSSSSE